MPALGQLTPYGFQPNGDSAVEGPDWSPVTAPVGSGQGPVGTSHMRPPLLQRIPQADSQPVNGISPPLTAPSAGHAVEQLQTALRQAQSAPRASGNALTEISSEVHDLRQSMGLMMQRMTTLQANLQSVEQQQPESRNSNQTGAQHAQHAQRSHDHAQGRVDATGKGILDQAAGIALEQLAAQTVHKQAERQQQHSMHSAQSVQQEAELLRNMAVKYLRGAVARQQQQTPMKATTAVNGEHAAEAQAAVPKMRSVQPEQMPNPSHLAANNKQKHNLLQV